MAIDWLPAPDSVTTATDPPAFTVAPRRVAAVDDELENQVYRFFETLVRYKLPDIDFRRLDAVASGPQTTAVVGPYDRDNAVDDDDPAPDPPGGADWFISGDPTNSRTELTGLRDSTVVVAEPSLSADRATVGERSIAAGTSEANGYRDQPGMDEVLTGLADADFRRLQPVGSTVDRRPERGLFPDELAYGLGLRFDGESTTVTVVRVFDSTPPEQDLEAWLAANDSPGLDGPELLDQRAVFSRELPTDEVTLRTLATPVRRIETADPAVVPSDSKTTVYTTASQFFYKPFYQDGLTVPSDRPVEFVLRSEDVVHGFEITGTPVDRTLVPGERARVSLSLDAGEYTVLTSRYNGEGTDATRARLTVEGVGQRGRLEEWLAETNNFDGSVTDATDRDEVTVRVGAEGNGGPFAFDPPAVRVESGTTVRWEWSSEGAQHSVTHTDEAFGTGVKEAPFSYEHVFDEAGMYRYYCLPHRGLGMKGAILVGG
ncbi:halocyanin domain-containing protein [Salinirussus salinus]|uniref:halocyanin domain-containing protein n=1 Tax=Salinirussus salinus TaxID=1198300 RepID=UPI001F21CF18|nr:halocyanin domain-containing protein [Salinirussus salinus]